MAPLLNALIGEYRIVQSLGAGGMGEVYKAVHVHLGRVIAIKVLSPELANGAALRRFYGEASIQASLKHPGVAEYLGFHEFEGRPCILMEFVDGETLAAIVQRRGPLPAAEAVRILRQVAQVAACFHAQGVVHRDLKTSNVKITSSGQVKILDFGIALHRLSDRLTQTGALIGTPEAVAPEQLRGEPVTPATDVWQMGTMLYELLTGRSPFQAATTHETFARIMEARFPPLSESLPAAPPELVRVVSGCLQRDPARRFASGSELYNALSPQPRAVRAHFPLFAAAAAAAVVLIVVIALVATRYFSAPSGDTVVVKPPVSSGASETESSGIVVDTMDGPAQVLKSGQLLGTTPYRVPARTGETVDLILRREGFDDAPVQFEAKEPHVYTYTLQPRKGR